MDSILDNMFEVASAYAGLDADARVQLEETLMVAGAYARRRGNVCFEDADENTITENNASQIRKRLIPAVERCADKMEEDLMSTTADDLRNEINTLRSLVGLEPRAVQ